MLDDHEHRLSPGTPEFERAERLVEQRKALRRLSRSTADV